MYRTSGTEPKVTLFRKYKGMLLTVTKIKYYLEASSETWSSDISKVIDDVLTGVVRELGEVWFEASRWGLKSA